MNWEKFAGYPAHIVAKRVNTDPWLEPWRDELVQELTLFLWQMFASGKVDSRKHEKAVSSYVYRGLRMRLTHEIRRLRINKDSEYLEGPVEMGEYTMDPLDNHVDTQKILSKLHPDERATLGTFFGNGGHAARKANRTAYNRLLSDKEAILAVIREQL